MSIKYWEFEDAPFKEKIKDPKVSEIAKLFFDNETEAYRFSLILVRVKQRGKLKLKDISDDIPTATAKRYLDYAVKLGLLKHENTYYELTDRYTQPFKNITQYIKTWMSQNNEEDLSTEFVNANTEKQTKRGGRRRSGFRN